VIAAVEEFLCIAAVDRTSDFDKHRGEKGGGGETSMNEW